VALCALAARATHATGSVRLHVTGRPPTTSDSGAPFSLPHPIPANGSATAAPAAALRSWRRLSAVVTGRRI
jgi:hypothetical protein